MSSDFFQRKITIIFLSISLSMCFECSKEPYRQHIIWLRNKGGNSEKIMVYLESWNGMQFLSERRIMVQKEVRACFRAPDNDIVNNYDGKSKSFEFRRLSELCQSNVESKKYV